MYKSPYRDATIYHYKELTLWEMKIPESEILTGPPSLGGPCNPISIGNVLIVTSFSPGMTLGFDKRTGKRLWKFSLGGFGTACGAYRGLAYAKSSTTLFCFDPKTGKVIWKFQPMTGKGEEMYSTPDFSDGYLYVGDRSGKLSCLNAKTGELLWSVPTGSERGQLNSTPLALKNVVVVVNTCRRMSAFDKRTGKQIWIKNTSKASIFRPTLHRSLLLSHAIHDCPMAISIAGKKYQHNYLKTKSVTRIISDGSFLWVLDREKATEAKPSRCRLLQFKGRRLVNELSVDEFSRDIELMPDGKSILIVHFSGFFIYSIAEKQMSTYISWEHGRLPMPSLPLIDKGRIYLITHEGSVLSLKLPRTRS